MPQKKKKPKTKIRYVEVNATEKSFVSKLIGVKPSHDFSDVKFLKSILSTFLKPFMRAGTISLDLNPR